MAVTLSGTHVAGLPHNIAQTFRGVANPLSNWKLQLGRTIGKKNRETPAQITFPLKKKVFSNKDPKGKVIN